MKKTNIIILVVAAVLAWLPNLSHAQTAPPAGAVAVQIKNDGPGSSTVWLGPGSPPVLQGIAAGGAPSLFSLGSGMSVVDGALTLPASTFGLTLIDDADAAAARSTLGLGTLATQSATISDYLTISSAASTYVALAGSYADPAWITALAWSKITGAPSFLTANQTVTLSGDITGSGATSIVTTIADDVVTFAKMQNIATGHLLGRHSSGSGDIQTIGIGGGLEIHGSNLRRSALTGDVTAAAGSDTTTLANSGVTAGTYAQPGSITVDAKGRVTGISSTTDWVGSVFGNTLTNQFTQPGQLVMDTGGDGMTQSMSGGGGGNVWTYGGNAVVSGDSMVEQNGALGGALLAYGGAPFGGGENAWAGGNGGNLWIYGGDAVDGTAGRDGGSIITYDGGGSINTRGVGSIQLGTSGTRTTINGAASSNWTLTLPTGPGSNGQMLTTNGSGVTSWTSPSGSGTVTSVAVSGSDGIQVDSGSPITSSGTIALGIDASALSTHLGLGGAALLNVGATTGTVAAGDDSRFHSAVTLAGSLDYLTLTGQEITRGSIDLTTDVTGALPIANGGTGQTSLAAVDAADFGSGAATDGQVLTADGAGNAAWETPTGGGGGGGNFDVMTSDTTANYDGMGTWTGTGLGFAMEANKTYCFKATMGYTTSGASVGMSVGVTGPASPTRMRVNGEHWTGNTASAANPGTVTAYSEVLSNGSGAGATERRVDLEGVITNGSNTGDFEIRIRVDTSEASGSVTLKAPSFMCFYEVTAP